MSGRVRVLSVAAIALLLIYGVPSLAVTAADSQQFSETGQTSSGAFYSYWLAHGQTAILGLPLTKAYKADTGFITQIYERAIFEWHPENPQENRVLLSRLGDSISKSLAERSAPAAACDANCESFAATSHTLHGSFRDFWQGNGGLANFGYPLTEEFQEKNADTGQTYTVQYFERNRFEWHPEINGGVVLLGRLGAQVYEQTKASVDAAASVTVPAYDGTVSIGFPVSYQFADGVSDADRSYVREGLALASDYFTATFGMTVQNPVTVNVLNEPLAGRSSDEAAMHTIRIFATEESGWLKYETPLSRRGVLAHELFHVLQDEWAPAKWAQAYRTRDKLPIIGPIWLMEGSAELVAYKALVAKGLVPYGHVTLCFTNSVVYNNPPALQDMETSDGFYVPNVPTYRLGALAVDYLTANRGVASLRTYFEQVGAGSWQVAFQTAFGMDISTFYTQFAQYRAQWQRPTTRACGPTDRPE